MYFILEKRWIKDGAPNFVDRQPPDHHMVMISLCNPFILIRYSVPGA